MSTHNSTKNTSLSRQEEEDRLKTSLKITGLTKDNFSNFYDEIPKKEFPMILNCPQENHIGVFPIREYSGHIDGNFMGNDNINLKDLLEEKIAYKECSNYDLDGVLGGSFKIMYPIKRGKDQQTKKYAVMNVEVGKLSEEGELNKHIKMLKEELEIQDAIYSRFPTLVPKVYSANIFPMYKKNPSHENCEPEVKMYLQIVMENIAVNGYEVVWKKKDLRENLIFNGEDDKETYWERNNKFLISFFSTIYKLHEAGYYHRDLNNMNIICNGNYDIRLIDFGFAKKREKNTKDNFREVLERDIEEEFFEGKIEGMQGSKAFNFLGNDQLDKIKKLFKYNDKLKNEEKSEEKEKLQEKIKKLQEQIKQHKTKYKNVIKELYVETVYKILCFPNNIDHIQNDFKIEKSQPPCKNVDYISLDKGSWKTDVRLVKDKNKVVVVYDRKSPKFYKFEWEEIQREMTIQNNVHEKTKLAPKVHFMNYTFINDLYTIMLIQDYAGQDGYKLINGDNTIKDLISLKNIKIKREKDNTLSEKFQEYLKYYNDQENIHLNEEDIVHYSDFFFGGNLKDNLESWYKKCSTFLNCFFKELFELHRIDVFHHDLSGQNVWYKKEKKGYKFKFIDFGLSTTYKETYVETNEYKEFKKIIPDEIQKNSSNFGGFMDYFGDPEEPSEEYNKDLRPAISTKNEENLKSMMKAELSTPECIHGYNMDVVKSGENVKNNISRFQLFNNIIGNDFFYFLLSSDFYLEDRDRSYRNYVSKKLEEQYKNIKVGRERTKKINEERQNSVVSIVTIKEKINEYRDFLVEKYAKANKPSS